MRIEFFLSPDGNIFLDEYGTPDIRKFTIREKDVIEYTISLIKRQFPEALIALEKEYERFQPNALNYRFKIVHRFIRCNFGKFDGLHYDIEDGVLHVEDVSCPLKFGKDCPLKNIICNPTPLGLSPREKEVVKMSTKGKTYDEISEELGITHSTIKNVIQNVKKKLHLSSSRDITKIIIATL